MIPIRRFLMTAFAVFRFPEPGAKDLLTTPSVPSSTGCSLIVVREAAIAEATVMARIFVIEKKMDLNKMLKVAHGCCSKKTEMKDARLYHCKFHDNERFDEVLQEVRCLSN